MKMTKEQSAILLYGFRMGQGNGLTGADIVVLPQAMKKLEESLQSAKEITDEVELDLQDAEMSVVRKLWGEGEVAIRDLIPRTQALFDNVQAVTEALKE